MWSLHLKLIVLCREPGVLTHHPGQLIYQPTQEAEETTESKDLTVVRNLPSLFIEVTFLGASNSDMPPQVTDCNCSKSVVWETII
jgi:hypothetical protein